MKIALIGYGKMGQIIERIAKERGHEIVLIIDKSNPQEFTIANLKKADIAIEFTHPNSAFENIVTCFQAKIPVISGTTGWQNQLKDIQHICSQNEGTLLHSNNFSVGVNIFFAVNRFLAKMMNKQVQYGIQMEETHHEEKVDTPSGTAVKLANDILKNVSRKTKWINDTMEESEELSILSKRIDHVPGTHEVSYISTNDTINISHIAHSREGFAQGAVLAAEWVAGKKGCFEMRDVLNLDF